MALNNSIRKKSHCSYNRRTDIEGLDFAGLLSCMRPLYWLLIGCFLCFLFLVFLLLITLVDASLNINIKVLLLEVVDIFYTYLSTDWAFNTL